MEKADWIKEFESKFNISFFGFSDDANVVYFENSKENFWVIMIDMKERSISVCKPSRRYTNFKLTENDGLNVAEELMNHTDHWKDLGLEPLFHPLDETRVNRVSEKYDRWIFSFERRVSENAFGRSDWAEF